MNNHTAFILIAVVIDIAITASVLNYLIQKRGLLSALTVNLEKFRAFNQTAADLVGNQLRSSYSGDPETLPALLSDLLTQLENKAKEEGLPLQREALKLVLLRAVRAQDGISARDAQSAMRKVA